MLNFWDTLNTYLKLITHYFQLIVIFHIPTVGFYIWKTHYLFTWSQIPEEIMNFKWDIHIVLLTLLLYLEYRINVKILHHLEYISVFSLRSPICLKNERTVRSLVMLNYQSVFTETIFTTLLFLCNSVNVAQLVKDKKGETCIHKLKRRWQWTRISEANNLECSRAALVCGRHRSRVSALQQESLSHIAQQDGAVHSCSLPSCCSVLSDHVFLYSRKPLASKNCYQSWQMPTKNSFPYAEIYFF